MEIVPVGPTGPSLEPVLEDYRRRHVLSETMVLNILIEALATRQAQALVALEEGRPVGGVILSRRGSQGKIHLLHTLPEAVGIEAALLARAEKALLQGKRLKHISATLALLPDGALEETFHQAGYRVFSRARMILDLAGFTQEVSLPRGYRLSSWDEKRLEAATALLEMVHRGAEDHFLYPELAGAEGARRLLERIFAGGFGDFDPARSFMVLTGESLVGLCLAVWHAALAEHGFIVDLCVEATHRRRGLGRALVVAIARIFREAGAVGLALAVTLSNQAARQLYEGLGFQVEQRFSIFRRST